MLLNSFLSPVKRPLRQGFTLVELLIVVAIVAVLAALAVPASNALRTYSNHARCMRNLHTIGVGLHSYLSDHNGNYPPNRYAEEGSRKFPHEALANYIVIVGKSNSYMKTRSDAGPWWCPSDIERPLTSSVHSYAPPTRLGGSKSYFGDDWQPWYQSPKAAEGSYRLVYLIDHNLPRIPLTTAGHFNEKSWPLPTNSAATPPAPGSDKSMVEFSRHRGVANALMVDGSVRKFTFEDLAYTRWKYVDPTR